MGLLSKIKKHIKRRLLQEDGFSIDEWKQGHKPFILYLGNGADGICYNEVFKQRHTKGRELSYGRRSSIYMALQKVGTGSGINVVNGFMNSQAEFMGFLARKKENGRWLWYEGQGWQPLSGDNVTRRLFLDGEDIGGLFGEDTPFIVLEAQWRHAVTKKTIRNGYPMYSNALMAHAFGALDGHTYCNTLAAYDNALKNGYRYFEVDFSYTEDMRLILCHGWEEKSCKSIGVEYSEEFRHMTYDQAIRLKVHGHSVMDARQFYRLVKERPYDVYQVDLHEIHGKTLQQRINSLLEDFSYDAGALDRLLIQVMNRRMYKQIDAIYHFKHYQYLVGDKVHKLDDILDFCLDHDICAVAMRANFAVPEIIQRIHNAGLYVMCYTIKKDADFAKYLLDMGVDTLCTDYVTEAALKNAGASFGMKPFSIVYLPTERNTEEGDDILYCQNDGTDLVRGNFFAKEGAVFVGWHLKLVLDETKYWYCTDGLYHGNIDFVRKTGTEKYLFQEGEALPGLVVKEGMTVSMIAAWEENEIL